MTSDQVIANLKQHANIQAVEGMARFGIRPAQPLGISIPTLRRMAREIGRNAVPASRKEEYEDQAGYYIIKIIF